MSVERFIITTSVGGRSYRKIWAAASPLVLDSPFNLKIHRNNRGVEVETLPTPAELKMGYERQRRAFEFGEEVPRKGFDLTLHRSDRGEAGLVVNILPVANISPVYESEHGEMDMRLWGQHGIAGPASSADPMFVFGCAGNVVQSMERLSTRFVGVEGKKSCFRLKKVKHGIYQVRSLVDDVEIKTPHRIFRLERKAESKAFSESELGQSVISAGTSSWYFARCPQIKAERGRAEPRDAETEWFRFALQATAVAFFTLMAIAITWPKMKAADQKFVETSLADKIASAEFVRLEPVGPSRALASVSAPTPADEPPRPLELKEGEARPAPAPKEETAYVLEPAAGSESDFESELDQWKSRYARSRSLAATPIEEQMYDYVEEFQGCYEAALETNPGLQGSATFTWTVSKTGLVSGVQLLSTNLKDQGFTGCLGREIARINFPDQEGGAVIVKFPFSFRSSSR